MLRSGPADNAIGLGRTNGMVPVAEKTGIKVAKAPDFGLWAVDVANAETAERGEA